MTEQSAPKVRDRYWHWSVFGLIVAVSVFGGLGTWVALARINSAVIAPGQVGVETNRKLVQHLEGGIVEKIFVREHQHVSRGDLLVRLHPTQADATHQTHRASLDAALALEARLLAESRKSPGIEFPEELMRRATENRTGALMNDQTMLFNERRRLLEGQVNLLNAKIQQLEDQNAGTTAQVSSLKRQLRSLRTELKRVKKVADKGFYPLNRLEELRRRIFDMEGRVQTSEAEIQRNTSAQTETRLQIIQTNQKFLEEVVDGIREVRTQIAELREKIRVASDIRQRLEIRAPQDGIIQNIATHTVGGVVRPGDTLMEIVPVNETFLINAKVAPIDINYVKQGLNAEVRFPGIKARTTPMILGKVHSVSADSISDNPQTEPYFLARVEVRQDDLPAELRNQRLTAGMPTEVIIATGERTVADYLISPLTDAARRSMRQQ